MEKGRKKIKRKSLREVRYAITFASASEEKCHSYLALINMLITMLIAVERKVR